MSVPERVVRKYCTAGGSYYIGSLYGFQNSTDRAAMMVGGYLKKESVLCLAAFIHWFSWTLLQLTLSGTKFGSLVESTFR